MSNAVDRYLTLAPEGQRPVLRTLRELIRRALPGAEECFESNMPVYKVEGRWTAGFAHRKKGPMFYLMNDEVMSRFEAELGKRRSGKSCIEMSPGKDKSSEQLLDLARRMLVDAAANRASA